MNRRPIALTCGDPAGVGPELIAAWLKEHVAEASGVMPIGPARWLATLAIPGIAVGPANYPLRPGQPDAEGQRLAIEAMEVAAAGVAAGRFAAVVTGPVNKKRLAEVGYPFPGQTEFFADRWKGQPVMAFAGGRMTVALATWHIPLGHVSRELTPEVVRRTIEALTGLRKKLGDIRPRIAVCGLNPHAGENRLMGDEDADIIRPVVEQLRGAGLEITGPIPGDTAFHRHLRGEFDGVVAMYHDQGLAPLKSVDFESAANLSLGLPFVRTSPDHGTAYEIAGQGKASRGSFDSALRLAQALST